MIPISVFIPICIYLQLLGDLDAPNPVEWPHDAMMVVLRFIYAADLAVPGSLAKQVKAAAER